MRRNASRWAWGPMLCMLALTSRATHEVIYTLSVDGKVLTADERFSGPSLAYVNQWVLEKSAPPRAPRP